MKLARSKLATLPIRLVGMAVLAGLLGACGGDENAAYPPPGQMNAVSVVPLDASGTPQAEPNLIAGGDFPIWWNGAPVPEGFEPPQSNYSRLYRTRKKEGTGYLARQQWRKSDAARRSTDLFRVVIPGLAPNTDYELAITASNSNWHAAHISLWEAPPKGQAILLERDFIVTQPGSIMIKQYSKVLTTRKGGNLIVAAHGDTSTNSKASITWYEWRLTRKGGGSKGSGGLD